MSKKYKSLFKYLVLSMIFITIITALISKVYSSYNPTREEFRTAETSSLLGKKLVFNGTLWKELDEIGQLSCFYHNQNAYNLMAEIYIHSVFDVGFDEQEGRMKIYSMINDGNKTNKTTFANSNNTSVGNLAAQSSRSNNAYGVYNALRKAIDEGTVVHEATIINEQEWWPDGVKNVETDKNLINLYNNYKRLSKEKTTYNLVENTDIVKINNKEYTIVGPLKISFGGKDITKVTVGNATWTKNSKESIYWSTDKKDWSNDFNKGTSAKYELNNKEFYIAVETSKLPDSGKYKITMEQDEFKYYKSRTIVCTSVYAQQTGMYCYDNNPTPVNGKVEWELDRIPTDKNLVIAKKDKKSGEKITGAGFKIYAVLRDGTKGWVSGSVDAEKKYESIVTNATEYSDDVEIKTLKLGEYYVFETKAPEGYELETQENYNKAKDGIPTPTGEWVYVGETTLNTKSSKTVTYNVTNKKTILGKTKIIKIDGETKQEITGGEFKIYAVIDNETKGWVAGDVNGSKTYEQDATKATTYASNVIIEKLKAGTYYYFETKAPEGYNMEKQEGYGKTDKDIANVKPSDSEYVYLGSKVIPKDVEETQVYDFTATNSKSVDKIEGYVWQDRPDTKANKLDGVYKEGTNDTLLEGIEVALYDNNKTLIATTVTNKDGYYSFTEKNASTYTGEDKNLYYSELTEGYVEFTYDNSEYICVDVLVGDDARYNSKAQESTMTAIKLDDNNIENKVDGAYPGKAVTDKSLTALTSYYDNKTYTISNINLGLTEKLQPDFSITEDVAYMKVQFGDYVYRYEYMKDSDQLTRTTVPTVMQQKLPDEQRAFTAKIYPSDVKYNETHDGELKVYMVYRIMVYNNTTHNIDNNYVEEKMYVESLTNKFDTERYELSKDIHGVDDKNVIINDFECWEPTDKKDVVNFRLDKTNREEYKTGVKSEFDENKNVVKPGYMESYVQFKLTNDSVNKILEKKLTEDDILTAPSTATATTFHEYWRADNVWEDGKDKYYEGNKQNGNYKAPTTSDKTHYLHKSEEKTRSSSELWMRFDLPEKQRSLSGVVFEDKVVTTDTKLGNGKKDDGENTVSGVTVELLDRDKKPAKVYPFTIENGKYTKYNEEQEAKAFTNNKGEFTIEGVIPGEYYLRFTYGDGKQKIYDTDGNVVKAVVLNDYKSTIIDVAHDDDAKIIQDAIKNGTNLEWYKELKERVYSTAIDNLATRAKTDGYVYYADGTIHYEDGTLVNEEDILKTIDSYTPRIAVTIEDSKDKAYQAIKDYGIKQDSEGNIVDEIIKQEDSLYYEFEGFNLGIITTPNSTIPTSKTISNIKLTDQTGATLVSADPKDKNAKYVTALDEVGSNVKAEIEENLLYGSEVEVTYNITLTNDSDIDYIENDEEHLGDWYNYGIKTEGVTEPKSITIKEVEDILNEKYNSDTVKLVSYSVNEQPVDIGEIKIVKEEGENAPQIEEKTTIEEDGTETTKTKMTITGWSDQMERTDTQTIEYTVSALLSSDNEDEEGYTNNAQVTKIKLDKLTPLTSGSEWSKVDETVVSITPPTGQDKTSTYYIAGAIALIVLASGIVIIKKRVLK